MQCLSPGMIFRLHSNRMLLEDVGGDDEALHLGGPLVYLGYSRIAIVALGWHVAHVTHATQHLDASVRVGGGCLGGRELGHGRLLGVGLACTLESGGLKAHGHVCQLELDCLELADRLVECFPVLRILRSTFERCRGDAERLSGDADATTVQSRHGDLEACSLWTQHAVARHAHLVEDEVTCGGGPYAQLVLLLA